MNLFVSMSYQVLCKGSLKSKLLMIPDVCEQKLTDNNDNSKQGILTEGVGSVQLTS
jgi:hypothetical protein